MNGGGASPEAKSQHTVGCLCMQSVWWGLKYIVDFSNSAFIGWCMMILALCMWRYCNRMPGSASSPTVRACTLWHCCKYNIVSPLCSMQTTFSSLLRCCASSIQNLRHMNKIPLLYMIGLCNQKEVKFMQKRHIEHMEFSSKSAYMAMRCSVIPPVVSIFLLFMGFPSGISITMKIACRVCFVCARRPTL